MKRYAPEFEFPPYSYVPGKYPHPESDPAGHSFGKQLEPISLSPNQKLAEHTTFLYAVDLFNHGYYWESHEQWEQLWHACGRTGPTADLLKGLIKLAAAGVKFKQGVPTGMQRHCNRAIELFQSLDQDELMNLRYDGINMGLLIEIATQICHTAETASVESSPADKLNLSVQIVIQNI